MATGHRAVSYRERVFRGRDGAWYHALILSRSRYVMFETLRGCWIGAAPLRDEQNVTELDAEELAELLAELTGNRTT